MGGVSGDRGDLQGFRVSGVEPCLDVPLEVSERLVNGL